MQTMRMEIGTRIRELRKARGWSQEKLGEMADLHPTYIGGIERGERNVALENLANLAAAFGLTLSQLFDFEKGGKSQRDVVKANLIALLRKRDERELRLFLKMVEAVDEWKQAAKG
ncbi:MAG: helix-turn-helix transcriptional regulator [Candidatus Aminicenantes bacterium]|nr:helix-turn-helix transcriptional regulator [Candidatus Aminicenantes bacterium]